MSAFQMQLNDYPHFDLTEDGHCVPRASIAQGS
jgi:hypothetical protein